MKKRTKRETLVEMLEVLAEKPRKPTHLMYKANLSHPRMKKLLEELTESNLVVEGEEEIRITEQGRAFLHEYKKAQDLFDSFGI
ncbi:MAG: winged helix-turn-helix domain-containing protein [Candidatus Woesearchaeota archaeon]